MKFFLISTLFIANFTLAQEVKLELLNKTISYSNDSPLFLIKIFNDSSIPIAIKCSPDFIRFSENDTLELGPYAKDSYSLDVSNDESRTESSGFYQLLIIN